MQGATVLKYGALNDGAAKTVSFFLKKNPRLFFKILLKNGQKKIGSGRQAARGVGLPEGRKTCGNQRTRRGGARKRALRGD
jgi:hypothetical protein